VNGQCLEADGPEEILEYWDFLWFLVLVLVSWIFIGSLAWWLGVRNGKHQVLQLRHVRSDRLGRLHAEATHKIVLLERRLDSMQDKLHTSEVYVAELLSARAIGRELVQRALREVKEHLIVCPRHHEVIHAPIAGRVWHAHRGCSKLVSASRVESLPPCSYCADGELFNLPDSYGMTLVEACEDWLRLTDD